MKTNDNIFVELDRRIQTTATNRFNASSRLNKHNKFSLWIVMLFSFGLILISILNTLKIKLTVEPIFVDISLIFFSIIILTISTALSMSNFGARAEKFLDCGRELHALSMNFKKIIRDESLQTDTAYEQYQREYEHILSRYENHKLIDHLYTRILWIDTYKPTWVNYLNVYFRFFIEYLIYIILFVLEIIWIWYLLPII